MRICSRSGTYCSGGSVGQPFFCGADSKSLSIGKAVRGGSEGSGNMLVNRFLTSERVHVAFSQAGWAGRERYRGTLSSNVLKERPSRTFRKERSQDRFLPNPLILDASSALPQPAGKLVLLVPRVRETGGWRSELHQPNGCARVYRCPN